MSGSIGLQKIKQDGHKPSLTSIFGTGPTPIKNREFEQKAAKNAKEKGAKNAGKSGESG
jgi:hypothetical protein